MRYGKAFERNLVKVLRETYKWDIETDERADREDMTDFTVFGWRGAPMPVPDDFQVTMQDKNGDKMRWYERTVWFKENGHAHVYAVYEPSTHILVLAQGVHRVLWRDLATLTSPVWADEKIGLRLALDGTSEYFDISEEGRILREKNRALTAVSARKRGTVVEIDRNRIVIRSGDNEFLSRLSDAAGNGRRGALKTRTMIKVGTTVTFLPVGADAHAIMIAKETKKRHEREEISI